MRVAAGTACGGSRGSLSREMLRISGDKT